jgi:tRNA(Met) C34 N-acetyltransferase TmcA
MLIDKKRNLQEDLFGEYSIVELVYLKQSEEELVKQEKLEFNYTLGWLNDTMTLI